MAFTTAFTKIGMKVNFSPSRFSKISLCLALHFTTLVTSDSMKEVTCGEVLLELTIASAMIFLTLSIGIISSPSFVESGRVGVGELESWRDGEISSTFTFASTFSSLLFFTNAKISSLVILPSKPEPLMVLSSASEMFSS